MNIYRGKHVDKRTFIEQYADIIQISDKECFYISSDSKSMSHTGSNMKCPKKNVKDDFVMSSNLHIYLKCPKIEEFDFRFLIFVEIGHLFYSKSYDYSNK